MTRPVSHETINETPAPLGVSHAHLASGPPLFGTAAHQKSRIHTDGRHLVGARHWSGTAVFSVIYAVLMHPYPYPAADRIVRLTVDSVAGSGDPVYLNGTEIQSLRQSPVVEKRSGFRQQRSDADRARSSGDGARRELHLE